jgi:hypothetical protein
MAVPFDLRKQKQVQSIPVMSHVHATRRETTAVTLVLPETGPLLRPNRPLAARLLMVLLGHISWLFRTS